MVKVAINGFGRIGRLAFRQMFGAEGYDVVAINDLTKPSMLAHLLKYDTAQGGYCGKMGENVHTVSADDEAGTITVDGKTLTIYAKANAAELPWGEIGVDVVLECTGFYCSKEKSQRISSYTSSKDADARSEGSGNLVKICGVCMLTLLSVHCAERMTAMSRWKGVS